MRYFIRLNPTKEFVQKLYRLPKDKKLQYHGEIGGWHHSFSYSEKLDSFIESEFTKEIGEYEMNEYLKGESDL